VRKATVNALRGLLYEFGVVLRGGRKAGLKALAEQRAQIDEQVPQIMRGLVDGQLHTLSQVQQRIDQLEHEFAALQQMLARRPPNGAAMALANKMARTTWALVAHGRAYQRDWQSAKPGCSTAQAAAA
jgi:hypothetical protein